MKSVMLSIYPKWCGLIASGKKTIEIRKTAPKMETPFKVYIYCTNDKSWIFSTNGTTYKGNGKVIGEFICDCVTLLYDTCCCDWSKLNRGIHQIEKHLIGMAYLTEDELRAYANKKWCYAWHITDLKIYDKPKTLKDFHIPCRRAECVGCSHLCIQNTPDMYETWCDVNDKIPIVRPPQSWFYVEENKK